MNNSIEDPTVDFKSSIVTATSSSLSILGGAVIILTHFKIPSIRNTTRWYLLFLTIADLVTAAGNLLGAGRYLHFYIHRIAASDNNITEDAVCVAQSALTTTSSIMSFLWTAVIALHLFLGVVYNKSLVRNMREKVSVHIVCWLLPTAITVYALAIKVLGEDGSNGSGPWCWIRTSNLNPGKVIFWRIVAGKGWEILTYLLTIILYGCMKYYTIQIRRHTAFSWDLTDMSIRKDDEAFCLAWLILCCLRIWGTIRFFFATFQPHLSPLVQTMFLYLQCFGDSGQAFFNFLLYCLYNREIRSYICSCWRRNTETTEYQNIDGESYNRLN